MNKYKYVCNRDCEEVDLMGRLHCRTSFKDEPCPLGRIPIWDPVKYDSVTVQPDEEFYE